MTKDRAVLFATLAVASAAFLLAWAVSHPCDCEKAEAEEVGVEA